MKKTLNVILPMNPEKTKTCKQQGSCKGNRNYNETHTSNHKETTEVSEAHNEKGRPREFNGHMT